MGKGKAVAKGKGKAVQPKKGPSSKQLAGGRKPAPGACISIDVYIEK